MALVKTVIKPKSEKESFCVDPNAVLSFVGLLKDLADSNHRFDWKKMGEAGDKMILAVYERHRLIAERQQYWINIGIEVL